MPNQHINTGAALAGTGMAPVASPFASLGGRLYAGYLLGSSYGEFSADRSAKGWGHMFDWSGNDRHLNRPGNKTVSAWSTAANSATDMETLFTPNDVLDGGGYSLVAVVKSVSTAKAVNLIRNQNADPYNALQLLPQSTSGTARAMTSDSGQVTSSITGLSALLPQVSTYAAAYTAASRQVFACPPAGPVQSGPLESTSKTIASAAKFHLMVDTGAGTGDNLCVGAAFYRGLITSADVATINAQMQRFLAAVAAVIA